MSMLEVKNLDVYYGAFHAIKDISMNIEQGKTFSIIGANGAGKTTLINAICGLHKASSGSVSFMGNDISSMKTSKIVKLGLSVLPEGSCCFEKMTVRDNLLMGAYLCKSAKERVDKLEKVFSLFPVLKEKENQLSTFLSGGQRQMLAVGRAIMTDPQLLICDEISLGLAPVIIKDIYAKLNEIAAEGITLLIIDQEVNRSLKYSDYAYIMLEGRIVMEGASKELDVASVNDAYFGMNKFAKK